MICRKIYIFILVSISFSSLADEQVYLTCNCTRAINSIITEGGCWDEEILITIDKKNKKLEWGSLEYPSLRQWMDYEIDGNNFKGAISRTSYQINRLTLVADSKYKCTGKNPECKGAHEFYSCKIINRSF